MFVLMETILPCQSINSLNTGPNRRLSVTLQKIIEFAQFYSKFIPQFKLQIAPLGNLTIKLEYSNPVSPH
jgi:hypothetical protein